MATRLATATANAKANAAVDLIDAGAGAGTIEIRTGTQPASANDAATGTLLGTLTLSDPAFGDAAAGVCTGNTVTGDSSADATGTAGWGRVKDSTGNTIFDGSVTVTGGGGEIQLGSVDIVAGGAINLTSLTYTQPLT